ncbi:MAG: enoyl-CoA hydratase/isomerase [Marmoricola sp.]|nr:enoyl-CoA hydratase/isomerase [Marmoricola sp.]
MSGTGLKDDLDGATRAATRLYSALAAGDASALDDVLAPDFVGRAADGLSVAVSGEQHGAHAMRDKVWWEIGRAFVVTAEPSEFHLLDDGRLYVAGRYVGHARRSKGPLDAAFVHVITLRDGLITRLEQLTDTQLWTEALGAAGRLETIDYRVVDGVAQLRLNRPDVRNAINLQVAEETLAVARMIEADDSVRAVLVSGAGPDLSVGGDIDYFVSQAEPGSYGDLFARMTGPFHEAFRILDRIDAPIVTAAQGSTAGGGLGYVFAADLVVAADDARFVTAFAGIGLSGDGGGTWHLPRLVGPRKAMELYLLNRPVTATEALEFGLVNELVPAEQLHEHALALATRLAQGPTTGYGHMRRLLRGSWSRDLGEQLSAETAAVAAGGDTKDAAAGIAAFLAKQKPTFEGR